ncbi:protein kinase [Cryptosporangium sp. NPDC051539]|uniref:serine/threonine-protein kinase n=1 Tax=Cryptosporangium sp. NPDC051539 TaxID=3363962 RepID=UPI0037B7B891
MVDPTDRADEADRAELAALLPGYDIQGELGRGAFGTVYAGVHRELRRPVAIKQLAAEWAADADTRTRFAAEGVLLAMLEHDHIVRVYDARHTSGACALVMERLSDSGLQERYRRGLTAPEACGTVLAVLAALHAAHGRRVLHRDIKPGNILFDRAGRPKVVDFGIAAILGGDRTVTSTDGHTIIGTPRYMSPEQFTGEGLGRSTDVYTTGVVLYELLTGRAPHRPTAEFTLLAEQRLLRPPDPIGPDVPAELAAVLYRALETDPADRYPTAEAFGIALAEAATTVYGGGWLPRSGLLVTLGEPVAEAMTRTARRPAELPTVRVTPPGWARTRASITSPGPTAAAPTAAAPTAAGPTVAGPTQPQHRPGTWDRADPGRSAPTRASATVPGRPPDVPRAPARRLGRRTLSGPAAVGCALLLVALAVLAPGAGRPADRASRQPVSLTPGATVVVPAWVDLSEPIPIRVDDAGPGTYHVELDVSVLGRHLGRAASDPHRATGRGEWNTSVLLESWVRWAAGGVLTGRLSLVRTGGTEPAASTDVLLLPVQPPIASLMGGGSVLVILFALAYLQSLAAGVRRGESMVVAAVGAGALGAVAGLGVWMAAAVLHRSELLPPVGVGCAVLGFGAFCAAVLSVRIRA